MEGYQPQRYETDEHSGEHSPALDDSSNLRPIPIAKNLKLQASPNTNMHLIRPSQSLHNNMRRQRTLSHP